MVSGFGNWSLAHLSVMTRGTNDAIALRDAVAV